MMVLPDFWYYMTKMHLSYFTGQCNGDMSSDGFPVWAFVRRVFMPICIVDRHWLVGLVDMESMVMTIYDCLKLPSLQKPVRDMMKNFRKTMSELFITLGDGHQAARFIPTFRWEYAKDV
ncbi:hypothetical protein L6452_32449 [Arctium lappa]|uniref:Uncharacterized protein n=1 Tax=Arctium lappa TaxID=4217 RepID=A0ACB8Z4P0_ARCLA|nr:hypothetical protein L6452_32449 [Arctium lappa]